MHKTRRKGFCARCVLGVIMFVHMQTGRRLFPRTPADMETEERRRGEVVGGEGPIISCGGPPELKTAICSQIDLSTPA